MALSLATLAERLSPNARVWITTSDAVGELPVDAQLSAQSKLARLGVDSPTAFQWVARNEKTVDWNQVRTEKALMAAAAARFSERAKEENYLIRLDADSDAARTEVNALRQVAAGDPQAANVLRQYEAAPAQRWGELLGYVNNQRVQNVREWRAYLTEGNEEYSKDPFWQDCAWDIVDGALTSDRNRGLGTTVHLNQGVLAELRQSINGKTQPVALASNYAKLLVEHARASSMDTVTTESARQWVYIPSKTEDAVNFQANVQKLKDLSCSSWCTKTYNAEPYLSKGGFWLLTEGNKSVCAIRLVGDKIQEIQGVKNNSEIPPEAGPDIEDLLAARPELKGVNLWRAKNPGTPPEVLRQLALQPAESDGENDPHRGVHCEIAKRPDLDEETALILARNPSEHVRGALAGNPEGVPHGASLLLASDRDEEVRLRLAGNEKLGAEAFEVLAKDEDASVRAGLTLNPAIPQPILTGFLNDPSPAVQMALINRGQLTAEGAEKLSWSKFPEVRKALASLGPIRKYPAAVARLAGDPKQHIRLKIAKSRGLSDETMLRLAKDKTVAVRLAIAERYDAPREVLNLLTRDVLSVRGAVVQNPGCGPEALLILAKDEFADIRLQVASHNQAPASALDMLSKDEKCVIAVTQNEHTSAETLAALATDPWSAVRRYVAGNDHTPSETLAVLMRDEDRFVRRAAAINSGTPSEALAAAAADADWEVRRVIAISKRTPEAALAALAKDMDPDIRGSVARNPCTPPEALLDLASNGPELTGLLEEVARNANTPAAAFARLSKLPVASVVEIVAKNPKTPPEVLADLVGRRGWSRLFKNVAHNPSTPAETLLVLSRDEDNDVRAGVASNPNVPVEALAELLDDVSLFVRQRASSNPAVGLEQLEALAASPDAYLREGVARNPKVSQALLDRLVVDNVPGVACAAARHSAPSTLIALFDKEDCPRQVRNAAAERLADLPGTEAAVLGRLGDDDYLSEDVALNLAINPVTPVKTLEKLASHYNGAVRRRVADNEATPKAILNLLATDLEVRRSAILNPNWFGKAEPVQEAERVPVPAPSPVIEPAVNPEPAAAVEVPAPAPEKPKELVFDKKRKDQLVFAFSMTRDGVEAYYDPATDTSVFLVDRIGTVGRGEELFFHENTHRNLTQFAKTKEGMEELGVVLRSAEPQLMRELPDLLKATGHKSLAELKRDYGFGDTEAGKTAVLSELMARHAEKMVNVEPPTWWRTLVNKVEVWFAKHAGLELSEGALTTWLARLPVRLPNPEAAVEARAGSQGAEQALLPPSAAQPKLFSVRAGVPPVAEGRNTMNKPHKPKGKAGPALDPDQLVTDKIIEALDKGVAPWRQPWSGHDMLPKNLLTGQEYTGTNIWLLMAAGYDNPWWVTYNQAQDLGGNVRKGEHGHQIVRWLVRDLEPKPGDEPPADGQAAEGRRIWHPKVYTVFNVNQCDGLSAPTLPPAKEFSPVLAAERVIENYADKPPIEHGFNHAAYVPSQDRIEMPNPEAFDTPEYYYKTLFHECVHSSGAPNRLNRNLEGRFGTELYAREEFVAELGAAVLASRCGISTEKTDEDSVAYCQSWKKRLQADKTLFRTLSKAAIEAARHIASDKAAPEPEAAPALEPELEPAAPSFSVPDRLSARAIGRLLGVEPTLKAIKARLGERDAFAGLHPDQIAQVVNGYERLRLDMTVEHQAHGNHLPGVPRVVYAPSRNIDPARLAEHTEAVLGRGLTPAEASDLGGFLQTLPKARAAVEASLGFNFVWKQDVPPSAVPDALHSAAGRLLDLDAGRLSPKEVARIFGPDTVAPETWAAIRQLRPVEPKPAGEVYDAMVGAVGHEKVHEALVRAGYDGLTSTERPLEAGRHWGKQQPAGLAATACGWEAFALDATGTRKVLPLTEEAVDRGVTLARQGVEPHVADQAVERIRPALKGVQIDVFETPEQLLAYYPKELHDNLMAAEALYDPALSRVRVIASNVEVRNGETPERAVTRVCLHEAVVHHGVRAALGDQADTVFTRIRAQAAAGFDGHRTGKWQTPERAAFLAVTRNAAYRDLSPARQGEEILARLQESAEPKQIGAWQRGVAACRLALGAAAPGLKLSVNDVDYLLWRGRAEAGRTLAPEEANRRSTAYYRAESAWVDKKVDAELKANPNGDSREGLDKRMRPIWTREWAEAHPETPSPKFTPPKLPNAEPVPEPEQYEPRGFDPRVAAWRPELTPAYRGPTL